VSLLKQQIDVGLFLLMKRAIHANGSIEIAAQGSSMFPFIREGNICRFRLAEKKSFSKGDIILFRSDNGHLIAHRLLSVIHRDEECLYSCRGDTNVGYDKLIRFEQVLGVLYSIRKEGKDILMSDLFVSIWTKAIVTLPFLSKVLNRYISRKKAHSMRGSSV
jgi:signal peptidase I